MTWGVPVVAHSAREAKRMVWSEMDCEFDGGWIDVSVRWVRGVLVDDLPFGLVEDDMVASRWRTWR